MKIINFGVIFATIHAEFHQTRTLTIFDDFCDHGRATFHPICHFCHTTAEMFRVSTRAELPPTTKRDNLHFWRK